MELTDPAGPQPGLLQDMVAKHAEPVVSHMLAALAVASGPDADLEGTLLEALQVVCGVAHFLPEMAADRWVELGLQRVWCGEDAVWRGCGVERVLHDGKDGEVETGSFSLFRANLIGSRGSRLLRASTVSIEREHMHTCVTASSMRPHASSMCMSFLTRSRRARAWRRACQQSPPKTFHSQPPLQGAAATGRPGLLGVDHNISPHGAPHGCSRAPARLQHPSPPPLLRRAPAAAARAVPAAPAGAVAVLGEAVQRGGAC